MVSRLIFLISFITHVFAAEKCGPILELDSFAYDDVRLAVASWLSYEDLVQTSLLSKKWYEISTHTMKSQLLVSYQLSPNQIQNEAEVHKTYAYIAASQAYIEDKLAKFDWSHQITLTDLSFKKLHFEDPALVNIKGWRADWKGTRNHSKLQTGIQQEFLISSQIEFSLVQNNNKVKLHLNCDDSRLSFDVLILHHLDLIKKNLMRKSLNAEESSRFKDLQYMCYYFFQNFFPKVKVVYGDGSLEEIAWEKENSTKANFNFVVHGVSKTYKELVPEEISSDIMLSILRVCSNPTNLVTSFYFSDTGAHLYACNKNAWGRNTNLKKVLKLFLDTARLPLTMKFGSKKASSHSSSPLTLDLDLVKFSDRFFSQVKK